MKRAKGQSLDRSLAKGILWTAGSSWAVQIVRWLSTLVVARILSPEDYGIVGIATIFTGLVQLISQFGLGSAIVQRGDQLTTRAIAKLGGAAALLGGLLVVLSVLSAPLIASFFDEPRAFLVIVVLAANFLFEGFTVVPRSLMSRDLQFRRLAGIDAFGGVVLGASTLIYALVGMGYWALVLGLSTSTVATMIVTLIMRPHPLAWPSSPSEIAGEIRFGLHVTATRIGWYIYSNADFAVVGRFFGTARLGDYTIAWTLASVPVERVTAILNRVAPAVMAAVKDTPEQVGRYICRITEGISILALPAAVGLALVAEDFVLVVLGEKWIGAVAPMQVLALAAAFRSLAPTLNNALVAVGRADLSAKYAGIAVLMFPPLFVFGAQWGIVGVAAVWLLGYPVLAASFMLRWAIQHAGLRMGAYLTALFPAVSSTAVMVGAVIGVDYLLVNTGSLARLMGTIGTGVAVYSLMILAFHRERIKSFLAMLRS